MTTSITQAKPLLTAAELELFDQSRAGPIKAFSAKQLAGKEKRTRTLRDKYRDLYRRQSVAAREKNTGVGATGHANARTQRKAEIMQEMLDRFEMRSTQLEAREAREAGRAEATGKKGKGPARKVAAPATSANPGKTKTGQIQAPEQLLSAVSKLDLAEEDSAETGHFTGKDPTVRSSKAPSPRAPTFGGKAHAPEVNAPLDMVAAAKRVNPVKNAPGNQAIQGHVSSSVRRSQGKRDSR